MEKLFLELVFLYLRVLSAVLSVVQSVIWWILKLFWRWNYFLAIFCPPLLFLKKGFFLPLILSIGFLVSCYVFIYYEKRGEFYGYPNLLDFINGVALCLFIWFPIWACRLLILSNRRRKARVQLDFMEKIEAQYSERFSGESEEDEDWDTKKVAQREEAAFLRKKAALTKQSKRKIFF